jgi:hypothetical protein
MEFNQLVVIDTPLQITEKLINAKEEIQKRCEEVKNLFVTEDNYKRIKAYRAEFNSEFKAFETARIDFKKQCLAPYENVELTYNDCIKIPYKEALQFIDEQINAQEYELKRLKSEKIFVYYNEYATQNLLDISLFPFEKSGVKINLSATENALKKSVWEYVDKVTEILSAVRGKENETEIIAEYSRCGNLTVATQIVEDRHRLIEKVEISNKIVEEEKQKNEEHNAEIQSLLPQIEEEIEDVPFDDIQENPQEITQQSSTYKMKFVVEGTLEQLSNLKKFLLENNIVFDTF